MRCLALLASRQSELCNHAATEAWIHTGKQKLGDTYLIIGLSMANSLVQGLTGVIRQ
jgi:hypothetical protein